MDVEQYCVRMTDCCEVYGEGVRHRPLALSLAEGILRFMYSAVDVGTHEAVGGGTRVEKTLLRERRINCNNSPPPLPRLDEQSK